MKPMFSKDNSEKLPHPLKDSLSWRIFFVYLVISIGLIVGINLILFANRNELFGPYTFAISISALLVLFLLTSLAFWLLTKKALKPLSDLISSIHSFLDGNWEQRFYHDGNDEVGILTEEFNSMAEEIASLYMSVEESQQEKIISPIAVIPEIQKPNSEKSYNNLVFLGNLNQAIINEQNPGEFLEIIFTHLQQLYGVTRIIFTISDLDATSTSTTFIVPSKTINKTHLSETDQGLISVIQTTRKPILINQDHDRKIKSLGIEKPLTPIETWLGIPILANENILGVMAVEASKSKIIFSNQDIEYLKTISLMFVVKLQNEYRQSIKEVSDKTNRISEITQKMRSTKDIDQLLRVTVQELHQALDIERAQILISPSWNANGGTNQILNKHSSGNGSNHRKNSD